MNENNIIEFNNICNPSDLEETFTDEFLLFSRMFADNKSVAEMLRAQVEDKLVTSFPNVNIAFRIYLSIFGTSSDLKSKLKLSGGCVGCVRKTIFNMTSIM